MRLLSMFLITTAALAQPPMRFDARHDHLRRFCAGSLTVDEQGVRFESETKKKHSWQTTYQDARQIQMLDNGEFLLLTYKDNKWRLGADREFHLRVVDKQFAAQVGPWLERRLQRRFVSGWADAAQPLWQLPVKRLLRFSGSEGVLVVAEDQIRYRSDKPGQSRAWLFSDIDSISTSDPYQFTVTSFERARGHYGDRKSFNFQLKQPLSEERYNELWLRLEKSKGLQIQERRMTP